MTTIREQVARIWKEHPALVLYGLVMLGLSIFTTIGIFVDPRVVTGQPVWVKPTKFALSTTIYSFSFVWLLTFVQGRPRLKAIAAWGTLIGFVMELAVIIFQAARGMTSHFNVSTPLDGLLWTVMANFVVLLWVMNILLAVLLFQQKFTNPALAWTLRLATVTTIFGAALAFYMTSPTEAQLAQVQATGEMPVAGAHSVGVPDGGPGLPFVGWSTEGGDVRPAHFFGLHALQVVPLLGWLVMALPWTWLSDRHRTVLAVTGAAGYFGFVTLVFWQALRAQPIIAPDALTLGALAALAAAVVAVVAATIAHARLTHNTLQPATA